MADQSAKFKAWLLKGGVGVTAVKADPSWNASVVKGATDKIAGKRK